LFNCSGTFEIHKWYHLLGLTLGHRISTFIQSRSTRRDPHKKPIKHLPGITSLVKVNYIRTSQVKNARVLLFANLDKDETEKLVWK